MKTLKQVKEPVRGHRTEPHGGSRATKPTLGCALLLGLAVHCCSLLLTAEKNRLFSHPAVGSLDQDSSTSLVSVLSLPSVLSSAAQCSQIHQALSCPCLAPSRDVPHYSVLLSPHQLCTLKFLCKRRKTRKCTPYVLFQDLMMANILHLPPCVLL